MVKGIMGVSFPIYVLDTHALVWHLQNDVLVSDPARRVLDEIEKGNALGVVPTIVLAEIVHLADGKRIPVSLRETITLIQRSGNFSIAPLDLSVVLLMIPLKGYEIHDRVIMATTKSYGATLVIKDDHIRRSTAVPCIW